VPISHFSAKDDPKRWTSQDTELNAWTWAVNFISYNKKVKSVTKKKVSLLDPGCQLQQKKARGRCRLTHTFCRHDQSFRCQSNFEIGFLFIKKHIPSPWNFMTLLKNLNWTCCKAFLRIEDFMPRGCCPFILGLSTEDLLALNKLWWFQRQVYQDLLLKQISKFETLTVTFYVSLTTNKYNFS